MLEFVESGTTVLLSELTRLVRTSSSEPSMAFRISTAPGMPARKTQTLKYVSKHVVPSSISLYKLWGILIGYLLSNPDLHPISTSRKELFGLHDMVIERGPRKATIVLSIEALKMH
jgi:hypothetical protein